MKLKLQDFGHLMWRTDSLEKTGMLGKIEREGDEMFGWHHGLNAHEFEQAPGVGDGQGGPWGRKESDTTERLNWTDKTLCKLQNSGWCLQLGGRGGGRMSGRSLEWPSRRQQCPAFCDGAVVHRCWLCLSFSITLIYALMYNLFHKNFERQVCANHWSDHHCGCTASPGDDFSCSAAHLAWDAKLKSLGKIKTIPSRLRSNFGKTEKRDNVVNWNHANAFISNYVCYLECIWWLKGF